MELDHERCILRVRSYVLELQAEQRLKRYNEPCQPGWGRMNRAVKMKLSNKKAEFR